MIMPENANSAFYDTIISLLTALPRPLELFNWLYAIDESEAEGWEGGLLVWHIKYQHLDPDKLEEDINIANNTKSSRLRHRLDIKKDDVQIVLPISKVIILLFFQHSHSSVGI